MEAFTYAITRHYWYELFMDDLPIWGFVGDIRPSKTAGEEDSVVLYTHKQLDISYNGDRVRTDAMAAAACLWACRVLGLWLRAGQVLKFKQEEMCAGKQRASQHTPCSSGLHVEQELLLPA